ncbi:hypothetical protein NLM27_23490 [Bradyrhizobium sp. CCGB12]|uniref:hypothetical protein n=1 Tax=Bradyrhizobium sp. CCGB12 TaxID=2949632 RepID=UPI0020B2B477|nr:hypothetical protein [Bradyrhizobium sp. CCGB12]MCP3391759.1 hypothetical protein [Bradyrhizobium sp. CCGB12]
MARSFASDHLEVKLQRLHDGQAKAYWALQGSRFKALRCGRRFGKTALAKTWISQGLVQGWECAWFAPQHRTWSEVYNELSDELHPIIDTGSKAAGVIRMNTGGRLDFWTLENGIAGRGRRYRRIVIDEAAFAKNGSNTVAGSVMELWEKAIKPTLYDYQGEALVCSNSSGRDPENFFYNVCTEPRYGFAEFRATTMDNPMLPVVLPAESQVAWQARRDQLIETLQTENDPLVYQQEYLAEFVDWSGVAFFSRDRLLDNGHPVPLPSHCDSVFAVIDTASKTGSEHDATAVTYFALNTTAKFPLTILDWDITQIEGALLETWLPDVFKRLEAFAKSCRARAGAIGAFIEDKNSGTILLQQALRRGWAAHAIESKLTALGKDERAISISGYVYQGKVKYTEPAFSKTAVYKQRSRNHLLDQVERFRVGAKEDYEDDLLDTFCYGVAVALGNSSGY